MKMQLAFCWAVAYSSSSHWISIFTHDSAFVTRTPPSGAGVVLSMSPERHNRQCLSKPNGWEHFTQKAKEVFIILCGLIRFNPEVLRLAMCYTHITWELHTQNFYSDLVGKSADNEGSGFSLFSPRISAHVYPQMFALHATNVSTTPQSLLLNVLFNDFDNFL